MGAGVASAAMAVRALCQSWAMVASTAEGLTGSCQTALSART